MRELGLRICAKISTKSRDCFEWRKRENREFLREVAKVTNLCEESKITNFCKKWRISAKNREDCKWRVDRKIPAAPVKIVEFLSKRGSRSFQLHLHHLRLAQLCLLYLRRLQPPRSKKINEIRDYQVLLRGVFSASRFARRYKQITYRTFVTFSSSPLFFSPHFPLCSCA